METLENSLPEDTPKTFTVGSSKFYTLKELLKNLKAKEESTKKKKRSVLEDAEFDPRKLSKRIFEI